MAQTPEDIVKLIDERKEFVTGDDGFVVFWPTNGICGAFTANNLRVIADELDRRNKEWESQLNDYFQNDSSSQIEDPLPTDPSNEGVDRGAG